MNHKNTVIIKEDGTSIDSQDVHRFLVDVRMTQNVVYSSVDKPISRPYASKIALVAYTFEDEHEVILGRCSRDGACNALLSLLEAIGREDVWDVRKHNSDQESDQELSNIQQGTEIAPSGGKDESVAEEQTLVEGPVIPPSKC